MLDMTTNVAQLLRVSTAKQVKRKRADEVDLPGQRMEVARYIESQGTWRVVRTYEEHGSAYKKTAAERQKLQELLKDARTGAFTTLIIFKHDRLSRQKLEYLNLLDTFEKIGVRVWSVNDNRWLRLDDTEFLMRAFEGFGAQKYSQDLSQRLKPRMRQLAKDGHWTGGRVPFGYTLEPITDEQGKVVLHGDRVARRLVPNEWAWLIKEVFTRYLGGAGIGKIAAWVNSLDHPELRQKVWSDEAIRKIIANPTYSGHIGYLYSRHGKTLGEEAILATGHHEAIVTKEQWDTAQELTKARATIPMRQRTNTYLLTGVARCAECGAPLGGITRPVKRKGKPDSTRQAYRCLAWKHKGTCTNSNMDGATADANFVAELERQLTTAGGLREYAEARDQERLERLKQAEESRRRMKDRLKQIETALRRLDVAYLEKGTIDDAEYAEKKQEYKAERAELEASIAEPLPTSEAKDYGALSETAKQITQNWPYLSQAERRSLVLQITTAWGLKVLVHPDGRVGLTPN